MATQNEIKLMNLQNVVVNIVHPYGYTEGILKKAGHKFQVYNVTGGEGNQGYISFWAKDVKKLNGNDITLK